MSMNTTITNRSLSGSDGCGSSDHHADASSTIPPGLAELQTADGTFLIQDRRSRLRAPGEASPAKAGDEPASYTSSPQMMGLGGVIILGVLLGSYVTKYDAAIGHVGGALAFPAVGFLALQAFLARAALRLFDDVRSFRDLLEFVVSRFFRYMPATVPAVLIGFAIVKFAGAPGLHADVSMLPANLFLVGDMIGIGTIDSSHWRLKIEIIQAVLVAAVWFGPMRRHLAVLLTFALLMTAFSINGEPARQHVLTLYGLMMNDGYLPLFVYGVALHQLTRARDEIVWPALMTTSAVLVFFSNTPLHGALVVGSLLVLTSLSLGGMRWLGRMRWLSHLGEIAFPIYVVHYVLGFTLIHRLEMCGCTAWVAIAIASLAAIALGKALNAAIERPIQRKTQAAAQVIRAMARQLRPRLVGAPRAGAAPVIR